MNLENIHSFKQLVETEIDGEKRLDCPFFDQCGFRRKYTQVHVLKAHIFKEHCHQQFLNREGVTNLSELYNPADDIVLPLLNNLRPLNDLPPTSS